MVTIAVYPAKFISKKLTWLSGLIRFISLDDDRELSLSFNVKTVINSLTQLKR